MCSSLRLKARILDGASGSQLLESGGRGGEKGAARDAVPAAEQDGFGEDTKEEGIGRVGIGLLLSYGCQRYFWADPIT
jgi:hypothetical protein